jgi:hypothetical protein
MLRYVNLRYFITSIKAPYYISGAFFIYYAEAKSSSNELRILIM